VHLTKLAPLAGLAVLSAGLLTACGGNDSAGDTTAGGGGGSSDACPLVSASDPGNSKAPSGVPTADNAPKLAKKSSYTIAFSQNASNNPWRLAETASMKAEAAKQGIRLTITDANNQQSKQIADIKGLIAQKPDARSPSSSPTSSRTPLRRRSRCSSSTATSTTPSPSPVRTT
jgi:ABC-type sugar transport system substrate-binding protein